MAHVIQEQTLSSVSTQFTPSSASRSGDHERLFQLLRQDGPAPAEFMLRVSDPVIERENLASQEI